MPVRESGDVAGSAANEAEKEIMHELQLLIDEPVAEEELDLDYTFGQGKTREITYAMSNSLGFGGHNATLIFKGM